jgi:hypothetical protein
MIIDASFNPTPCFPPTRLHLLGEPTSLLVVANAHPPLSLVCQQLPHPLPALPLFHTPQFMLHYLHRWHQQLLVRNSSYGTVLLSWNNIVGNAAVSQQSLQYILFCSVLIIFCWYIIYWKRLLDNAFLIVFTELLIIFCRYLFSYTVRWYCSTYNGLLIFLCWQCFADTALFKLFCRCCFADTVLLILFSRYYPDGTVSLILFCCYCSANIVFWYYSAYTSSSDTVLLILFC